jgi:hypothetical protein
MAMTGDVFLFWVAVAVVTVMSAARLTRLVTQDVYPPAKRAREAYIRRVIHANSRHPRVDVDWSELVRCPYCAAPYITAAVVAWGALTDWHTPWWVVNGVLAAAYAAAIVVERDGA